VYKQKGAVTRTDPVWGESLNPVPEPGANVSYDAEQGSKGPAAANVQTI